MSLCVDLMLSKMFRGIGLQNCIYRLPVEQVSVVPVSH